VSVVAIPVANELYKNFARDRVVKDFLSKKRSEDLKVSVREFYEARFWSRACRASVDHFLKDPRWSLPTPATSDDPANHEDGTTTIE
jgi:hypothetical protein